MKLMIIDGNSVVNRAFYGVHMLNAPDGTPTNAVYGFLNIYRSLLSEVRPDAVAVTFDMPAPTFRHEQYEGYKAQRKGMPDELAVQMPVLKEVLDDMNVKRFELSGWEADDLMGTIARISALSGWDCQVVTGDRDSFQLINSSTSVRHIKTKAGKTEVKVYDEELFYSEYGFEPIHIIDLKALMGDASDNIPGVAGVGEKTAMDLIQRFKTVDYIYGNIDSIDVRESVRKKLVAGEESARMSYELATIRCTAPIEMSPEECMLTPPDNDSLYGLFKKLGFKRLIESFGLTAPAEVKGAEKAVTHENNYETVAICDGTTLKAFMAGAEGNVTAVSCDELMEEWAFMPGGCGVVYTLSGTSPVFHEAAEWVFSPCVKKAGHNIKDRMRGLISRGFSTGGWFFDAALAGYLLDPTSADYSLERLCEVYCGGKISDANPADGEGQLSLLGGEASSGKPAADCSAILALYEALYPELREKGLEELYLRAELPLCPVLAEMEHTGFLVDRTALSDFGEMLSGQIDTLTEEIFELAGHEFNINSPKQLGEVLFEELMLPAPKKTKRGYSTNADVLEKLKPKHPIVGLVLDYRELAKLKSTYADGLTKVIGEDGRIHTSFQMTVTATGRLSSTEPNLQNIPVRRELGSEIRKMFVADEGNVLVDADYSQVELRILAHISGDEAMRETFLSGEDIHAMTASQVLGIPLEEVTPAERSRAKAVNFGIVYGISAFSLADDIGTTVSEARDYINAYMARYSGVSEYMERVVREAKERGYAVTLYGRRRPMPELKSSNYNVRSFGERVARNMPIQGTAADIMKIAMVNLDGALKGAGLRARILLQVHDELIVECPEDEKEEVAAILKREMEGAAKLSVPLTTEVHWGKTWHDAK